MSSTPAYYTIRGTNQVSKLISPTKTVTFNIFGLIKKLGMKVIARLDCRAFPRPTIQHMECSPLLPESSNSAI